MGSGGISHPSKKGRRPGMTVRQSRFVDEYLQDPSNATQAAIRAGYKPDNANYTAYVLLKKEKIQAALAAERASLGRATWIDTARIMHEEGAVAFSDIRQYPTFEDLGIPDSLAPAISSVKLIKTTKTYKDGTVEEREEHHVALWPKGAALERLERMHGMFEKDNLQRPGATTNVSVQNMQVNQVSLDLSDLTDEELKAIEDAWERKRADEVIDVVGIEAEEAG